MTADGNVAVGTGAVARKPAEKGPRDVEVAVRRAISRFPFRQSTHRSALQAESLLNGVAGCTRVLDGLTNGLMREPQHILFFGDGI